MRLDTRLEGLKSGEMANRFFQLDGVDLDPCEGMFQGVVERKCVRRIDLFSLGSLVQDADLATGERLQSPFQLFLLCREMARVSNKREERRGKKRGSPILVCALISEWEMVFLEVSLKRKRIRAW